MPFKEAANRFIKSWPIANQFNSQTPKLRNSSAAHLDIFIYFTSPVRSSSVSSPTVIFTVNFSFLCKWNTAWQFITAWPTFFFKKHQWGRLLQLSWNGKCSRELKHLGLNSWEDRDMINSLRTATKWTSGYDYFVKLIFNYDQFLLLNAAKWNTGVMGKKQPTTWFQIP